MADLWSSITTREVLGLSWRSILGLPGFRDHVTNPQGLVNLLEQELPYRTSSQTAIPLHLVCTQLVTGEEVAISEGNVIEAILASAAIPGVFPPVLHKGRHLYAKKLDLRSLSITANRSAVGIASCHDPAGSNQVGDKALVDVEIPFVFAEIADGMTFVEHTPDLWAQIECVRQHLKHDVTIGGSKPMPAQSGQTKCMGETYEPFIAHVLAKQARLLFTS